MPHLTRPLLLLILVLLIAISAPIAIGQHQPQSKYLSILHLGDCAPPCWVGIQPSITTVIQAKMLIEKAYNSTPDTEIKFNHATHSILKVFLASNSSFSTEINLSSTSEEDDASITEISFIFTSLQKHEFTLGDLGLAFPPPTHLRFIPTEPPGPPYLIALGYVKQGVLTHEIIIRTNDPLKPTDAVLELNFFKSALPFSPTPDYRPWLGFTSLDNYFSSK